MAVWMELLAEGTVGTGNGFEVGTWLEPEDAVTISYRYIVL